MNSNRVAALVVGFLAALSPAQADDWTIRDGNGQQAERIEDDGHGGYTRRDASGRRLGTVEQSLGGYVLRDSSGRRTGTVEAGPGGYVQRDSEGQRVGTMEQDATGRWVMRDTAGRRAGTVERRQN